ncbi:MAG: peptidylprolyl isomerase [Pseudomonadota bacterium]
MTIIRTLIAAFAIIAAPLAAQDEVITGGARVAEPTVNATPALAIEGLDAADLEPAFETVDIVLSTAMGDITIALETERAPITAANFLRYVDEGRFDGTVFYRAMNIKWGDQPNGLLQGGTQFDPKRILDPIAHEPTTETGLSHTKGALSMARYEPGTATGDFSIMVGDQTGLDARPNAETADQRLGYAVFGYVVDGMEVVEAIHAAPIDPEKGEGWMKGQMLADPVAITQAKRAVSEQPE